jgi:flagellar hook assembly protein FlgD
MSIRYQQEQGVEKQKIRRLATSKGLSFGPIATAITVGTVAVLLGVTFIGDWLRTPQVSAEASPTIISPNSDKAQDTTNFSYTLNEDAEVSVNVFNESNIPVRKLKNGEFQTRGQHVSVWDGRNELGQPVPDGHYRLEVSARGTMRSSSQSVSVLVDTLPPMLRLANLDEVSKVKEANFTVEGLTDAEAVVQLDGDPTAIAVDTGGQFSLKKQLVEGANQIRVSATDPAGNATYASREVVLITRPPELVISNPVNGAWTNESLISVAGVVPEGTTIKVNGQEAEVNAAGEFAREVILQEGENILRISATDDVGNITSQEMVIRRKTLPPELTVNVGDGQIFQQTDVQIIGKTEPGARLTIGGKTVAVSSLGEFQTMVNLLQGDNMLDVVAQDQAGNVTKLQRRLRFDVTVPETELARVARNLPSLSTYFVPVLVSLPVLLILAYWLTRPVALMVSSESSSFQPGLPEEGRFLRLSIDLSKAARTTVEIKDRRGNVIATLLHRRHRGNGQHSLYWDGYDDFGRVAAPGEYTVEATASTTGGTVKGTLIISVLEDRAVHRHYLRRTPYAEETVSVGSASRSRMSPPAQRSRRR